ncbi:serine/threonine protein kinase [Sorangium sp. So ce887]|uniref:serine/threonine protein kinase n=1 Tax=Sorangium sp. So ce887 TaxID=3133324 RepID=UPI003F6151A9
MVDGSGLGYRIVERLQGRGPVDVYAAVDREGRDALLHVSEAVPGGFRDGLARLRAVSQRIEEVPRVLDGGLRDSFCWVAVERCDGRSLRAVLEERPRDITPPWALSQVAEFAEVLKAAHAAGIFHGDLCPETLILLDDGSFKLAGLGLAQLFGLSAADAAITAMYRAPEQLAEPAVLDERTDVHALGLVLYELIGLRRPFAERVPEELVRCVLHTTPLPLDTFVPLPPVVAGVVRRATERHPDARYRDMAELIAALHGALEGWCRWRGEVKQDVGSGVRSASPASRVPPTEPTPGLATELPPGLATELPRHAPSPASPEPASAPPEQAPPARSPRKGRIRVALALGAGGLVLAAALLGGLHAGALSAARTPAVARLPRVIVVRPQAAPAPPDPRAVAAVTRERPLRSKPVPPRARGKEMAPSPPPVPDSPAPGEPLPPCDADWYTCGATWPDARSNTFR